MHLRERPQERLVGRLCIRKDLRELCATRYGTQEAGVRVACYNLGMKRKMRRLRAVRRAEQHFGKIPPLRSAAAKARTPQAALIMSDSLAWFLVRRKATL